MRRRFPGVFCDRVNCSVVCDSLTRLTANCQKNPDSTLSQFFLIDQSLDSGGGHHFDYATCIADAAQTMGFETVVATNRKLDANIAFENSVVAPVFRNSVYHRSSSLAGLKHLKRVRKYHPEGPTGAWQRTRKLWTDRKRRSVRQKIVQQFAADCASLFERHELCLGDHVFLMTISELELMGLAEFLRGRPQLTSVSWHLQFHFNLFDGRTPEFDDQRPTLEETQRVFREALAIARPHHLQMYTTSEPLRDQYQRLNVCDFSELPYPVCPEIFVRSDRHDLEEFQKRPEDQRRDENALVPHNATSDHRPVAKLQSTVGTGSPTATTLVNVKTQERLCDNPQEFDSEGMDRPLRFTCPGQIRREKGCCGYLQRLVNELWDSHLAPGRIQIAVQRPRRKFMRSEKLELKTPAVGSDTVAATEVNSVIRSGSAEPIEYLPHPLKRDAYIEFIRSADCGLLLYDSRAYYSRRAGVLGELLSCGKPVIVPAGCWLSEQIAESNYRYADDLFDSHSESSLQAHAVETYGLSSLTWDPANVPTNANTISFDQDRNPFSFRRDINPSSFLKLSFEWKWPRNAGTFCRISLKQFSGDDLVATTEKIVGQRQANRDPNALFRVDPATDRINISMSNAYSDATAMVRDLKIELLSMSDEEAQATPTGAVGIIAACPEDVTDAVREMTNHISHYRKTAGKFSRQWSAIHHPERTVARLIQAAESPNSFDSLPQD